MGRRSKFTRKEIARIISSERRRQPGYDAIVEAHHEQKRKASDFRFDLRRETFQKIRKLLTGSPSGAFAQWTCDWVKSVCEFIAEHLVGACFVAALSCFFLGWLRTLEYIFAGACALAAAHYLSTRLLSARRLAYRDQIFAMELVLEKNLRTLDQVVADHFTTMCDEFVGYPPDWENRRHQILRRDGFTCQRCQHKFAAEKLHVHHIVKIAKGGTNHLENLLTLCGSCHGRAH